MNNKHEAPELGEDDPNVNVRNLNKTRSYLSYKDTFLLDTTEGIRSTPRPVDIVIIIPDEQGTCSRQLLHA